MLSVIVPVYNEKEGVRQVLDEVAAALQGVEHEVVVVDDCSTDGSREILEGVENIRLVEHGENCGYGASIKDGMAVARGDSIAIIDADGTYPPARLPEMLELLKDHRMVVGERKPLPTLNRLAKIVLKCLVWILTRKRVPDLNSGLRVFRKEVAEKFLHVLPDGYSFTTTLTIGCLVNHYSVCYVPIHYSIRRGTSKIRPVREFFNFVLLITRLVTYFKPLEVFLPASMVLFLSGVAVGLYSLIVHHRVMDVTTLILIIFSIQTAFIGLLADIIIRKK